MISKKMSRACSYGKATTSVAAKVQHVFELTKYPPKKNYKSKRIFVHPDSGMYRLVDN
jgi:hypothetical protein